jgi:hypothetical protein
LEGVGHSGYLLPIDHVINSVARYRPPHVVPLVHAMVTSQCLMRAMVPIGTPNSS